MAKEQGSDKKSDEDVQAETEDTATSGAESDLTDSDPTGADPDSGPAADDVADDAAEADSAVAEAEHAQAEGSDDRADLDAALAGAPLVAAGAPAAQPVPDDHHDDMAEGHHDEEHHEDEQQRSLAGRVLTGLILLLVGAGLALWAAPRIAPHLPDGLGPVKAWMMPGEMQSQERIAQLEGDLGARIDAIEPGLAEDDVTALIEAKVAEATADLETRVAELSDNFAAADTGELQGRLAQLESRIEGLSAQLGSLGEISTEGLSDEQAAEISSFAAAVEGLRAEVSTLAQREGELAQRIDEVEAEIERRVAAADAEVEQAEAVQSAAAIQAALARIDGALASGGGYAGALETLREQGIEDIPEALSTPAEGGVSTLGMLRTAFSDAAHDAIRADVKEEDAESVTARLASFLEAQVATRSLTPQEGDDTDAVLSRAEDALRRDDLEAALAELETLPPDARAAMQGWIDSAKTRREALAAFADLDARLTAQN